MFVYFDFVNRILYFVCLCTEAYFLSSFTFIISNTFFLPQPPPPQRTGLLSMLDVECSVRGTPESYIQKVKVQHKGNLRLFEPKANHIRSFGIHHFANRVIYDASDFLGE